MVTGLEHPESHTVQQDGQNAHALKPCDRRLRVITTAGSEQRYDIIITRHTSPAPSALSGSISSQDAGRK